MDGLECSEILYSIICQENRYDAEYYQKKYIDKIQKIIQSPHYKIKNYYKVTDGEHGSVEYLSNGVKYLTAENVKYGYIDISNVHFVSPLVDERNSRARVNAYDILISIKGTLGSVAIADENLIPCNMNRDVAIIKSFTGDTTKNSFVAYFLMSQYGLAQSMRGGSGGVQQMITLARLKEFIIPSYSNTLCRCLNSITANAQSLRMESSALYTEAQNILLKELHFDLSDVFTKSTTEKFLSESFGTSGRLDAEYYQPKYDDLFAMLNTNETVGSLCHLYDNNFIPSANTKYRYIELANIGVNGSISDVAPILGKNLPTRARRIVKTGQVIISSIEGSLNSCSIISDENDGALCSTGFYVIDSDYINSETLLVLFQSEPMQAMMKQRCSGTILTAISKNEFLKMPLPVVSENVQCEISEKVQKSFALRRQAEKLIETAVKAVEIAIENDEAAAIAYIEANVK